MVSHAEKKTRREILAQMVTNTEISLKAEVWQGVEWIQLDQWQAFVTDSNVLLGLIKGGEFDDLIFLTGLTEPLNKHLSSKLANYFHSLLLIPKMFINFCSHINV
jgi:hypothetical protein